MKTTRLCFLLLMLLPTMIHSAISEVSEAEWSVLLPGSTHFASTDGSQRFGPSIGGLIQANRDFYATMDTANGFKIYQFENQNDADNIQLAIFVGEGWNGEWYYVGP